MARQTGSGWSRNRIKKIFRAKSGKEITDGYCGIKQHHKFATHQHQNQNHGCLYRMKTNRNAIQLLCQLSLLACALFVSMPIQAGTITWKGYTWTIKSGAGLGPGPNSWNSSNAYVDASGYLHLVLAYDTNLGAWDCAEVSTTNRLGFGTYQWQVENQLGAFDPWVVLGLFPYLGPDGNDEIDVEYSRWGNANGDDGWWTVYPATGKTTGQKSFNFALNGTYTTSRFVWSTTGIQYWLMGGFQPVGTTKNVINSWNYTPATPAKYIPQGPMPLHMNLWLFRGHAPSNGQPVEVIIHDFSRI
jgi:hypothetical protein